MFSFFKSYTEEEKQYLVYITNYLSNTGISQHEVKEMATDLLDGAIEKAKKDGLRGVKTLGISAINNRQLLLKRQNAGLSIDDVLAFRNRDYVLLLIEEMLLNTIRFSMFRTLTETGKSADEAVKVTRKKYIHYGDPDESHSNYQGEDADIYPEFALRYEKWRSKISPDQENSLAKNYSTYNAMVRDLIRRGVM